MYFIFFVSLSIFLWGLTFKKKINPITLFGSLWTFVCLLYLFYNKFFFDISFNTIITITSYMLLFTFGCYVTYKIFINSSRVGIYSNIALTRIIYFASICVIILTPLVIIKYWQIANSGPTLNLLINLRYQTSVIGTNIGILQYVVTLSLVMSAILNVIYSSGNTNARWLFRIIIFCAFVMHAALLARAQMLSVIIVYLIIANIYKRINARKLILTSIVPIVVFYLVTIFLNKGDVSIGSTLANYFVPPIIALDISTQNGIYLNEIKQSILFSLSNIGTLFGFKASNISIILPFVNTPIPTNLYTFVAPYYGFGGLVASSLASILIGILHGFLWGKSISRRPLWICGYSISFIALIGQFGGEAYLTIASYWIQVFFWLLLLCPRPSIQRDITNTDSSYSLEYKNSI